MAADPSIVQQAHEWVDRLNAGVGISGNWRLQVLQKRYRKNATEECGHELPMRIRRFAPGCPWALVDEAIRYLISLAPYGKQADADRADPPGKQTAVIYNGLLIEQNYRPTLTQWLRDEQTSVDEQRPQNGTYTLVQDLIEDTECDDEETAVTGESCSEEAVTTWHWDDDAPGDLADYATGCEQGVTYAITQVNRKEDGTFDWALVKRIARTQHSGPVVVECTETSRITQETWDNLYGNVSDGFRAEGCEYTGTVNLPDCGDSEPGRKFQVQISENQDCTFKAVVTVRESFEYGTEWTDGTACRRVENVNLFNQREEPVVPQPDIGETVQAQVKRNDDDSYDASIKIIAAPEELFLNWEDGNACRPREVTHITNARVKPDLPAVGPGETLNASMKKNDDCTWDATFELRKPAQEELIEWDQGSECRPQHVYSYQNSAEIPEVPERGTGKTVSGSIRRNEDCTYDAQFTVTEASRDATYGWTQGSPCRPETVTAYQNSAEMPEVPRLENGKIVSASIRRNDDCTYDAQISVKDAPTGEDFTWEQGSSCRPEHVTRILRSVSVPSVPRPTEGQIVQASITKNEDDCTYDAQVVVKEPGDSVPVEYDTGSECTTVHEVVLRNAAKPLNIPQPRKGQTVTANISRQDDCTYDSRYALTTSTPDDMTWTEGSQFRSVEAHHSINQTKYSIPSPKKGESVTGSVTKNQDCTYDVNYKIQLSPSEDSFSFNHGNACNNTVTTVYQRSPDIPDVPAPEVGKVVQASIRRNEDDGSYDGTVSVTESAVDEMSWTEGNARIPVTAVHIVNSRDKDIPVDPPEHGSLSGSVTKNQDCTYDISYKLMKFDNPIEESWEDGPECKRTHHTIWENLPDKPDIPDGAGGETVHASLNYNSGTNTWSGQMAVTDALRTDERLEWKDGPKCQRTLHTIYIDSVGKPVIPDGSDGEVVHASLSFNEANCTWNGQVAVTERPTDDTMEWNAGSPCVSESVSHYVNQKSYVGKMPTTKIGTYVTGEISRNQDCTYDVRTKEVTVQEFDSGMITWDSKNVSPRKYEIYEHGLRVITHTKKIEKPKGSHNWTSYSVDRNEDCTYNIRMMYTDLKEWGVAGEGGGIRENDEDVFEQLVFGREGKFLGWNVTPCGTIHFSGVGNEATEYYWALHGVHTLPPGVKLAPRVYVKWLGTTTFVSVDNKNKLPNNSKVNK